MKTKQLTTEWGGMDQREKESRKNNQTILELNQNEKRQNLWGTLKAALKEIFIALSTYILHTRKSTNKWLNGSPQKFRKTRRKLKPRRQQALRKIKVKINEI